MHLCLACYPGEWLLYAGGHGGSDLDPEVALEVAVEAVLQVHEAAEAEQSVDVLLAVEGAEHAGEVVGGSDLSSTAVRVLRRQLLARKPNDLGLSSSPPQRARS